MKTTHNLIFTRSIDKTTNIAQIFTRLNQKAPGRLILYSQAHETIIASFLTPLNMKTTHNLILPHSIDKTTYIVQIFTGLNSKAPDRLIPYSLAHETIIASFLTPLNMKTTHNLLFSRSIDKTTYIAQIFTRLNSIAPDRLILYLLAHETIRASFLTPLNMTTTFNLLIHSFNSQNHLHSFVIYSFELESP